MNSTSVVNKNEKISLTGNRELIVSSFEDLSITLQNNWLEIRKEFMASAMDWFVENDYDIYDSDKETIQFLLTQNDTILAGMRLTRKENLESTLSWKMLPDLDSNVGKEFDKELWDLTRLVPGKELDSTNSLNIYAELFGSALGYLMKLGYCRDITWVFATRPIFIRAFKRYGIEFTEMENAKLKSGVLCYSNPIFRTQYLISNREKYKSALENVIHGFKQGFHY